MRTMRTQQHFVELEREIDGIAWDIIGLSETRLRVEKTTISSQVRSHPEPENTEANCGLGGVGFLINKSINHMVSRFCTISERVVYITLKLEEIYTVKIISEYAPTSASEDEEVEQL